MTPAPVNDVEGARILGLFLDSITTDHISPAGAINPDSPAGKYLVEHGVQSAEFNSYGSRRGHHEVVHREDQRNETGLAGQRLQTAGAL